MLLSKASEEVSKATAALGSHSHAAAAALAQHTEGLGLIVSALNGFEEVSVKGLKGQIRTLETDLSRRDDELAHERERLGIVTVRCYADMLHVTSGA